jgi:hypothetical protein
MALSGGAWAQEDLEQGKSAAQLFASDCGICHKSAQALVKDGYPTEAFLRVHYTSNREIASALFTYLRGIARADPAAAPKRGKKATREKAGEEKPTTERKPRKPENKPQAASAKPESTSAENASRRQGRGAQGAGEEGRALSVLYPSARGGGSMGRT